MPRDLLHITEQLINHTDPLVSHSSLCRSRLPLSLSPRRSTALSCLEARRPAQSHADLDLELSFRRNAELYSNAERALRPGGGVRGTRRIAEALGVVGRVGPKTWASKAGGRGNGPPVDTSAGDVPPEILRYYILSVFF